MTQTREYLSFRLGKEHYALDVANAREVIEITSLAAMPKAPAWVRGMVNLRGSVVPVLDLKRKFEMGDTELAERSCVVIVEFLLEGEPFVVGVLVDAAAEVFEYPASQIEAPPRFGTRFSRSYLRGMGRRDDYLFVILEADKVFADTDVLELAEDEMPPSEKSWEETADAMVR
jgi:purine-binding chemotaxis protein CheW